MQIRKKDNFAWKRAVQQLKAEAEANKNNRFRFSGYAYIGLFSALHSFLQ